MGNNYLDTPSRLNAAVCFRQRRHGDCFLAYRRVLLMFCMYAVSWIRSNAFHVVGVLLMCGIVFTNKAPRVDWMDEVQQLAAVTPAESSEFVKRFVEQTTHAMSLYGQMVDAAGLPIAGAQVRGTVIRHRLDGNLTDPVFTERPLQAVTDVDGRFELFGVGSQIKITEVAFADGAVMAPNPRETAYQREHFEGLWGIQSITVGGPKKAFVSTADCPSVFVRIPEGCEPSVSATEGGIGWVRNGDRLPEKVLVFGPEPEGQAEVFASIQADDRLDPVSKTCKSHQCVCPDVAFQSPVWSLLLAGTLLDHVGLFLRDLPE